MKKLLLTTPLITIFILTFFFTSTTTLFAQEQQETDQKVKVFVSDTCPYCEELLKTLEEQNLLDTVEVIEISEEPNNSEFRAVVEECQVKNAVPLLYDGERCYQGQNTSLERVYAEEGIVPIEEEAVEENVDQITSIEEENPLNEEDDQTTESNSEPGTEEFVTGEENSNLSEKIFGAEVQNEPPEVPPLNIVVMLIAPITLLGLGYYIITKMKV